MRSPEKRRVGDRRPLSLGLWVSVRAHKIVQQDRYLRWPDVAASVERWLSVGADGPGQSGLVVATRVRCSGAVVGAGCQAVGREMLIFAPKSEKATHVVVRLVWRWRALSLSDWVRL